MSAPPLATPEFLAEHYVYELTMLRASHALLFQVRRGPVANALIESFAVHARALMDFFGKRVTRDDALAAHFTPDGTFAGAATAAVPESVRERLNKQITHLTYARVGAVKIGIPDRILLLRAIEADHAIFKKSVAPEFLRCFDHERRVGPQPRLRIAPIV
jgi:hypothetical protein